MSAFVQSIRVQLRKNDAVVVGAYVLSTSRHFLPKLSSSAIGVESSAAKSLDADVCSWCSLKLALFLAERCIASRSNFFVLPSLVTTLSSMISFGLLSLAEVTLNS